MEPFPEWVFVVLAFLFAIVLGILVPMGIAAIAVKLNTGTSRLDRPNFFWRVAGTFVGAYMLRDLLAASPLGVLPQLLVAVVGIGLLAYWAVDRLRDMHASSTRLALLVGIPLVGQVVVVYLMVRKENSATPVASP
jgi:hypothetical protein